MLSLESVRSSTVIQGRTNNHNITPKTCSYPRGSLFSQRATTLPRAPTQLQATFSATGVVEDREMDRNYEQAYLKSRTDKVRESFPGSLTVEDFIHRLEIGLYSYGFSGENSIACTNLCRDEITCTLREKIDTVFGNSFNVNGLGGVLTSGVLGMGAGLSHSPIDSDSGKERYVFFSFPHIALSPFYEPGGLTRPGRPGKSAACGALLKALSDLKEDGLEANCKTPGVHEPENPEYSILKQRLARRIKKDGKGESDMQQMGLVDLTKVAERAITSDLEFLISKAVDPSKADYAVVTGVQIHSWGKNYGDQDPNLEYVYPCVVYTVVNGQKTAIDVNKIPALTPRQTRNLAHEAASNGASSGKPRSSYLVSHRASSQDKADTYRGLLEGLENAKV